jgi:hypothetical protein
MKQLACAALALGLLPGCGSNEDETIRTTASIEYFGAPVALKLGDMVRVEGLLTSDGEGNLALMYRSGAGPNSGLGCVVMRNIPWPQKLFLPSPQADDLKGRSFEAIGEVVAGDVAFGRGAGFHDGPQRCLFAIDVETLGRRQMPDELARRLRMPPDDIVTE